MSRLGEAIQISRAPGDVSEHRRHMGINLPTIASRPLKAWSELQNWEKPDRTEEPQALVIRVLTQIEPSL
jgi:hypothetical protein